MPDLTPADEKRFGRMSRLQDLIDALQASHDEGYTRYEFEHKVLVVYRPSDQASTGYDNDSCVSDSEELDFDELNPEGAEQMGDPGDDDDRDPEDDEWMEPDDLFRRSND